MLLDFFEDRLDLGKLTTMGQAENELNKFIKFNDRALLSNKGRISHKKAKTIAEEQYKLFSNARRSERIANLN